MERTASQDMREEKADLLKAAEQSMNVVLDLGLDGTIRWVSQSWKDVVGTPVESIQGKAIAEVVVLDEGRPNVFSDALESIKKDDSKSQIVRFQVRLGPLSVLRPKRSELAEPVGEEGISQEQPYTVQEEEEQELLDLEGQGIIVHDRSSPGDGHVSHHEPLPDTFVFQTNAT